jgi:hypothetical protein
MPGQDSYEFDQVPGYQKPTHQFGRTFGDEFHAPSDDELLASYAAFTQRGVTLAGGQGVVPTGCALAQHTASKKYFIGDQMASDGRQTVLGLLRDARDTGGNGGTPAGYTFTGASIDSPPVFTASPSGKVATDCLGNLVIRGIVNLSLVSGQDRYALFPSANMASGGQPPVAGAGGGLGSYAGGTGIGVGIVGQLQARIDPVNFLFIF